MNTLTVTRIIEAQPDTVWAHISDVTAIANWHPAVERVDLLSPNTAGQGATRRCNFYDGSSVVEEVETAPRERTYGLDIREFAGPITTFKSEWEVTALPSGASQLTLRMAYEMKFGLLGTMMNAVVVRSQMAKRLGFVLDGLQHHIATGEVIGQNFRKAA